MLTSFFFAVFSFNLVRSITAISVYTIDINQNNEKKKKQKVAERERDWKKKYLYIFSVLYSEICNGQLEKKYRLFPSKIYYFSSIWVVKIFFVSVCCKKWSLNLLKIFNPSFTLPSSFIIFFHLLLFHLHQ